MPLTAVPAADTEHQCVRCRALPELPGDVVLPKGAQRVRHGYRPAKPAETVDGGPKSRVCLFHKRERRGEQRVKTRVAAKARKFRMSPELQLALWIAQGGACPCGAKAAAEPPAGVALDHDHDLAAIHDHPDDEGCIDCVLGYLCPSCNRDIVGRLTGARRGARALGRAGAASALRSLADHLDDPPLRRLLAERPHLALPPRTETAA